MHKLFELYGQLISATIYNQLALSRDLLFTGIVRKIYLGYYLLIGIARIIGLEGGLLIRIVRTIDVG